MNWLIRAILMTSHSWDHVKTTFAKVWACSWLFQQLCAIERCMVHPEALANICMFILS